MNYTIPDEDFEGLTKSRWPELEINNLHIGSYIEIWACTYGSIYFFWRYYYTLEEDAFEGFDCQDRLFETRGEALNDCLEFIQDKMNADMDTLLNQLGKD